MSLTSLRFSLRDALQQKCLQSFRLWPREADLRQCLFSEISLVPQYPATSQTEVPEMNKTFRNFPCLGWMCEAPQSLYSVFLAIYFISSSWPRRSLQFPHTTCLMWPCIPRVSSHTSLPGGVVFSWMCFHVELGVWLGTPGVLVTTLPFFPHRDVGLESRTGRLMFTEENKWGVDFGNDRSVFKS